MTRENDNRSPLARSDRAAPDCLQLSRTYATAGMLQLEAIAISFRLNLPL